MVNSYFEKIYRICPTIIQNLIVSSYGYIRHRKRYGKEYKKALHEIENNQGLSKLELQEVQMRKLSQLLEHAYENVPYYHNLFKEIGLLPKDISCIEDLAKIPILDKEQVRKDPLPFIAKNFRNRDLIVEYTSGSTGTPLKVFIDKGAYQKNYAFYEKRCQAQISPSRRHLL